MKDPFWKVCVNNGEFEGCDTYAGFKHAAMQLTKEYLRPLILLVLVLVVG